ncbi:MAG: multidrug transporter subunit MdtN [Alphaproteobacteria bacterium]|nr:multidrug transporter subunit MdtN [Alphaproteobacteria bacterium]
MLRFIRKSIGVVVSLAAFAGVILLATLTVWRIDIRPRTDDAYLYADVVHLAPEVSGRIIELAVRDNQAVRRDDVLFRIDPVPFQLRVDQAQATVRGLEAKLGLTADQVAAQTSTADTASHGIITAEAQLTLASSTLARMQPLLPSGYVTAEQVDQARTAKRTAEIALQQARLQAQSARQAISNTKPAAQELEAARAMLAMAERDLRLSVVRSPCDGRITALDIAAGEFAVTGKPLFTIIDTENWYAIGNFRETDLMGIKPGQRALIYVMQAPQIPVRGVVDSIGGGVKTDEGANILGLPYVPRTLNWVRIAQRFPVRILLKGPPASLMRIGASVAIVIER